MAHVEYLKSRALAPAPSVSASLPLAFGAVLAPTLIRWSLQGVIADMPFVFYFPFILVAAVILGWRWAMLTAGLGTLAGDFLFIAPRFELLETKADIAATVAFVLSASVVIYIGETMRTAIRREAGLAPARSVLWIAPRRLPIGLVLLAAALLSLAVWAAATYAVVKLFS
jgi:K+-sensing histidine kinase KdpD